MQQGRCIFIFISVIYFTTTVAFDFENFWFKCPADCSVLPCIKKKILRNTCKGGTVYDICGCCQRCAQLEGEPCGGYQDAYGKCDVGFFCHVKDNMKSRKAKRKFGNGRGRCKVLPKKPKEQPLQLRRGNQVSFCQPECNVEFCSKWPDAICSAVYNAKVDRHCQYPCQHTVCSACYFEPKEDPPCRKCEKDDFHCFRIFSRCVKKDYCTRLKYPCHPHARRKSDGVFKCKVSACPSND